MTRPAVRRTRTLVPVTAGAVFALALAACGSTSSSVTEAASSAASSVASAAESAAESAMPSETPSAAPSVDIAGQSIVVSNWENYMDPDTAKKFEAATKVKATIAKHATNEEIVGKLTAGADSGIDVAFVSSQYAQALNEQGLLEPLNPALIPAMSKLQPETKDLPYDKGLTYSVPYSWGTTGLCYRKDLTGYDPDSWNDLLKPKDALKKKTLMLATQPWMNLPAAKALGYSANTTDPAELEAIKAQLIETKATLLGFDDTNFYTRLAAGEVALVESWDGWCNYAAASNKNVKFVVPKEGADLWADVLVVLKSSKHKEAAQAFLNYIIDDASQTWMTENIQYKSTNKAVFEKTAGTLGKDFPNLALTPADLLKGEGLVDLGDAAKEYSKIATEVQAS